MLDSIQLILVTAIGYFVILNPIGIIPTFFALTQEFSIEDKQKVAFRSCLASFIILSIFTISGTAIFNFFSIEYASFSIAGGIIIFARGWNMLQGPAFTIQKEHERQSANQAVSSHNAKSSSINDVAIIPLAMPILAGPGTISKAMDFSFGSIVINENYIINLSIIIGIWGILLFLIYCILFFSKFIVRMLGTEPLRIASRFVGLLHIILGTQKIIQPFEGLINMNGVLL